MHASALFKYSCLHKFIVNFFRELKRKTKIRIQNFPSVCDLFLICLGVVSYLSQCQDLLYARPWLRPELQRGDTRLRDRDLIEFRLYNCI